MFTLEFIHLMKLRTAFYKLSDPGDWLISFLHSFKLKYIADNLINKNNRWEFARHFDEFDYKITTKDEFNELNELFNEYHLSIEFDTKSTDGIKVTIIDTVLDKPVISDFTIDNYYKYSHVMKIVTDVFRYAIKLMKECYLDNGFFKLKESIDSLLKDYSEYDIHMTNNYYITDNLLIKFRFTYEVELTDLIDIINYNYLQDIGISNGTVVDLTFRSW